MNELAHRPFDLVFGGTIYTWVRNTMTAERLSVWFACHHNAGKYRELPLIEGPGLREICGAAP